MDALSSELPESYTKWKINTMLLLERRLHLFDHVLSYGLTRAYRASDGMEPRHLDSELPHLSQDAAVVDDIITRSLDQSTARPSVFCSSTRFWRSHHELNYPAIELTSKFE